MKKQQVRKIVLGRETLRQLDGGDLAPAAGGSVATHTCYTNIGCEHMTSFVCGPPTQGSICL